MFYFSYFLANKVLVHSCAHRVHRVATAAFWRTFSDEGKISPGWWGWGGGHAHPPIITFTLTSKVAVYAPAEWADTLTLFLFHLYQYMYSVVAPHPAGYVHVPYEIHNKIYWCVKNERIFCEWGIIYSFCCDIVQKETHLPIWWSHRKMISEKQKMQTTHTMR